MALNKETAAVHAVLTKGSERVEFNYGVEEERDQYEALIGALNRLKEESGAELTLMVEEEKSRLEKDLGKDEEDEVEDFAGLVESDDENDCKGGESSTKARAVEKNGSSRKGQEPLKKKVKI
eukprot:m.184586 g.184586  ORF g.184586 m.184586 type:complete len:122 (+) comp39326_c0_seq15:54-419(+)